MPAFAADWNVTLLLQSLAQRQAGGGHARFVETKYIALLDKPQVSRGELVFTPPDRLEKHTLEPKPEVFIIDNDRVELERRGKHYSMRLADRPEAVAFADSIRGALTGNQRMLEASYALALSGPRDNWDLRLTPTDAQLAKLIDRIDIKGSADRIHAIEYEMADGDRTVMSIEPIAPE